MDEIRQYLIGVITAAIVCAVVTALLGNKGVVGTVAKLLTGLLMLLAVISPWVSISLDGLFDWTENITADSAEIVSEAKQMAEEQYRAGIKQRVEAYVLEKAESLQCSLTVDVHLSEGDVPTPERIVFSGNVSPFAKSTLTNWVSDNLGIGREEQAWMQ